MSNNTLIPVEEPGTTTEDVYSNLDQLFLILMGLLIFFMQLGVALYEAGSVRSKNTTNVLLKNLLDMFFGGLAYWAFGYAFAFGHKSNAFIGYSNFFLIDLPPEETANWFFHYSFAATAATIVSGAMAERTNFLAYLIYSSVITGFVYPTVSHWAWSSTGWLGVGDGESAAYKDFAGSGVVHMIGGTASLIGAWTVGPRLGRFDENGKPVAIFGHTVPLMACGGFILIFGFLAFNGGSQASITQAGDAAVIAKAILNSILAACGGAVTSMMLKRVGCDAQKWSFHAPLNGAIMGMVCICAGCNALPSWSCILIGSVAGVVFVLGDRLLLYYHIDDPINAGVVHLGGGFIGVVLSPIFTEETGIIYKWDSASFKNLGWNIMGAIVIFAWTLTITLLMFRTLRATGYLRVPREIEIKGLDMAKHGEPAYPPSSYGDGWFTSTEKKHYNGIITAGPSMDSESVLYHETRAHKEVQRMSIVAEMSKNTETPMSKILPPIRETRVTPVKEVITQKKITGKDNPEVKVNVKENPTS